MNFQGHLEGALRLLKANALVVIMGGLLVQLLVAFSLGVLAGPMLGAYLLSMILYARDRRKPVFNDYFAGLQRFGALFPFFFLLLLVTLGFFLLIIPGLIFIVWWIYALPLMADKGMGLSEAMRVSRAKVQEKGFFMHLVFIFMITVIPDLLIMFLSSFIPLLQFLFVLVPPLQAACLASLYLEQFEGLDPSRPGEPAGELASS